jgi:Flp pilus assembly protein TadG
MKSLARRHQTRRGAELVEFALVLPLIVMLFFGAIEAAQAVRVSHSLQEAAQAGCRVYSVKGTTKAQATTVIANAMTQAGITQYNIGFNPPNKADVNVSGEAVTVTVSTSFANVAWISGGIFAEKLLSGACIFPADVNASEGGDQNGYNVLQDDNTQDGMFRHETVGGGDDD